MYYTVFIIQQKFLLNIMFWVFVNNEVSGSGHEVKVKVAQSGPALWDLVDCSLPGSSVLGILQARMLNWAAHSLLQRIFLTQRSNPGLPHCKWILYHLSHQGSLMRYKICLFHHFEVWYCVLHMDLSIYWWMLMLLLIWKQHKWCCNEYLHIYSLFLSIF